MERRDTRESWPLTPKVILCFSSFVGLTIIKLFPQYVIRHDNRVPPKFDKIPNTSHKTNGHQSLATTNGQGMPSNSGFKFEKPWITFPTLQKGSLRGKKTEECKEPR